MMVSFCGVGNPFSLGEISQGATVLDIGCGAGFDLFCAARAVGPTGKVIGIDLTPEMVDRATVNLTRAGIANVEIHNASVEQIPLPNETVDLVISNGVLNLSPDKERTFSEIARVLKPGGVLQFADIVLSQELPADQKSANAWSN
jgi:ubiquinone/menaquinone biosynthesis C-methylase UbiE